MGILRHLMERNMYIEISQTWLTILSLNNYVTLNKFLNLSEP
jgi:hypothetical protein